MDALDRVNGDERVPDEGVGCVEDALYSEVRLDAFSIEGEMPLSTSTREDQPPSGILSSSGDIFQRRMGQRSRTKAFICSILAARWNISCKPSIVADNASADLRMWRGIVTSLEIIKIRGTEVEWMKECGYVGGCGQRGGGISRKLGGSD